MEFKEVLKGIDSLYVSYKGTLKEGLKERLEEKKKLAQSEDAKEQALAVMTIDDHCFEVLDKGTRWYSFILVDNWYHLQISGSKRQKLPQIYVQISSELLTCYGLDNAINELRKIVPMLLEKIEEETVSRTDVFTDFTTNGELETIEKVSWITRAQKTHKYWNGDIFTGWTIGQGGDILARLYDKTVEIEKSRKDYLREIWEKQGWDTFQRVWRLEFQLRRELLGQMKINTYSSLMEKINDMWKYCTRDWLRLAIKETTINRTRWKTNPLWEKIQDIRFHDGKFTGILREVDKSRIPSDKTLYQNGIGYITAYAAREGHESVNPETVNEYLEKAKNYLREQTNGRDEEYLKTKIRNKKKKYNKA
ncbi:conserved hypothetical protein [Candidatus Brocadia pituitae]|nr:conserved hypothetical protein [Candidatus Brocadia pituitae]